MKIYSPQIIGTLDVDGSAIVTGSLDVSTSITASNVLVTGLATVASASITYLDVIYETASVIFSSGSNQFGDASDDVQTLYGTVDVQTGPLVVSGSTILSGSTDIQGGDFKVTDQNHNAEFDVDTFKVQTLNGAQFTGSVAITGSLGVTGSVTIVRSGTNAPFLNSVAAGAPAVGQALAAVASGDPSINASAIASGIFGATNGTIGVNGYQAVIVGGDEHDVNGIRTGVFGGYNNNITVSNSYIFGGGYNDITGGSSQQIILGGNNFNITAGTDVVGIGGLNNTISGGSQNAILAGSGHTNNQNRSVIIGGQNITATAANTVYVPNFVATGSVTSTGGFTGSLQGTASFANNGFPFTGSAIITGSLVVTGSTTILDVAGGISRIGSSRRIELGNGILNNSIGTLGDTNGIIVCNGSSVSAGSAVSVAMGCGSAVFSGTFAAMIGCEGTQQATTFNARGMLVAGLERGGAASNRWANDGASTYSALVGGGYQRMEFAKYTGILGGSYNYISGSSTFTISGSAIIGGNNNTAKHNNVVILGGNTISATAADTVYVPNFVATGSATIQSNAIVTGSLTVNGAATFNSTTDFKGNTVFSGSVRGEVNALSITSNTASLNCALDNFFTLQLVQGTDTRIEPSNINPGQTINLRVNTTGSATVSFPSSVKQVSGSSYVPTTTTGTDIVTFISFDSSSLFLNNVKNLA